MVNNPALSSWATRVDKICHDRSQRVIDLRGEGKKIFGYFCCFTPVEILTAADVVPFRIAGNLDESSTPADAYIETIACSFTRSCFALAVNNGYKFLDGYLVPHSCDNIVNLYNVWKYNFNPAYSHFLNIPHTLSKPSFEFFQEELKTFIKSLEIFTGREITAEKLNQAIKLHNENRALMRELNAFRKSNPPLISGAEMNKIFIAVVSLPVLEANYLLKDIIKEIKQDQHSPEKKSARLLVYGTVEDNTKLLELIEECGANVVIDDLSFGTRTYWHDVSINSINDDPLKAIAERYLAKIPCPRTYIQRTGTHQEDLENRFAYLYDFIKEFNVNGVILYVMQFCDTHAFDVPDIKEYLAGKGIQAMDIEGEYSTASLARIKTRVEAFVEMLG